VRLHRVLATRPEKVYRAFLEADALAKWLPPNGFACTVHHLEPKVGGTFKMSFRNFTTGKSHAFGGEYVELVPSERLRYTDKFDDPNLPGEMQVTVTLKKVSVGTELDVTQAGVPDVIPPEACYLGWHESLRNLARLVELEINQQRIVIEQRPPRSDRVVDFRDPARRLQLVCPIWRSHDSTLNGRSWSKERSPNRLSASLLSGE
jgi:uncharacterized protein YndB with AHSA1/START domain